MVKELNQNEFSEAIASGVSVVDFNATWCAPCKMLAPILDELSDELSDKVKFYAVDVDEAMSLAQQYRIMSIPAVAVFKNGELADMSVGLVPKSELQAFVEKYL